ncbi:MAG: hypothetical protein WBG71_13185 [Leeuwenhoekiella sp.]
MAITIHKGSKSEDIQKSLKSILEQKQREKKTLIEETFGKVKFDLKKSPETIQKEMRDEWG